jgi:hypothetical protein
MITPEIEAAACTALGESYRDTWGGFGTRASATMFPTATFVWTFETAADPAMECR